MYSRERRIHWTDTVELTVVELSYLYDVILHFLRLVMWSLVYVRRADMLTYRVSFQYLVLLLMICELAFVVADGFSRTELRYAQHYKLS